MILENDLRNISILKDLSQEELGRLGSRLQVRRADRGAFIVSADEPAHTMMFLASGEAKVTHISDDGKEVVVAILESGEFFGELALLTGDKRSANVIAMTDCLLYVISAEDLFAHLQSNSGLALAMLKELAHRLRFASTKIGHLALYDVYERTAKTLLTLADSVTTDSGVQTGTPKWVIEKRPTHQELASMVGTSREMVTRALKELEDAGFLRSTGRRIEIFREKP